MLLVDCDFCSLFTVRLLFFGRMYCCWLAVCIVVVYLFVFLLFSLRIFVGLSCLFLFIDFVYCLLVGRE